jgi:hypothetical protein
VLLAFLGVAKKSVIEKQEETATRQTQQEESPARKELNKVYKVQDSQGRTQYTNVAKSPNAKLVDGEVEIIKTSVPVEIIESRVIIPVTISNKGTQLHTSLVMNRNSNKTVIPVRVADFVKAEEVRVTGHGQINGQVVSGETRQVSHFRIGPVTEENFMFIASDIEGHNHRGILGMDFIVKHPFHIDTEQNLLFWE